MPSCTVDEARRDVADAITPAHEAATVTSRVNLLDVDSAPPDSAAVLRAMEEQVGRLPYIYRALASAPDLLNGWVTLARGLWEVSPGGRQATELGILRVAQKCGSSYVWRSHLPIADRAGVPESKIAGLDFWYDQTGLYTEDELVLLRLADAVLAAGPVPTAVWHAVEDRFGKDGALELVVLLAWYGCVGRVAASLQLPDE